MSTATGAASATAAPAWRMARDTPAPCHLPLPAAEHDDLWVASAQQSQVEGCPANRLFGKPAAGRGANSRLWVQGSPAGSPSLLTSREATCQIVRNTARRVLRARKPRELAGAHFGCSAPCRARAPVRQSGTVRPASRGSGSAAPTASTRIAHLHRDPSSLLAVLCAHRHPGAQNAMLPREVPDATPGPPPESLIWGRIAAHRSEQTRNVATADCRDG